MDEYHQNLVSDSNRRTFDEQGVVLIPNVLSYGNLEMLRKAVDMELENKLRKQFSFGKDGESTFRGSQDMWRTDETFSKICTKSVLPSICADLMSSMKINMFFDHLFVKDPGSSYVTSWHNDVPYWPVRGKKIISLWLALDDVSIGSGALVFCLGSHKWDIALQPRTFAISDEGDSPEEELRAALPQQDLDIVTQAFPMKAGDLLAFDAMAIHRAGANKVNNTRRRGYAIRYTGDDVTYEPRPGVHKMMLENSITPGEPMDSDRYPVVFRKDTASWGG